MAYWPSTPFTPYLVASYDETAFYGLTFCSPREECSTTEEYYLQNPMTAVAFSAGFEAGLQAAPKVMAEEQRAANDARPASEANQVSEAKTNQARNSKQARKAGETKAPKKTRRKARDAIVDEHGWWPVGSGTARSRDRKESHKLVPPPTFETCAEKEAKARAYLRERLISLPVETDDDLRESIKKTFGAEEPLGLHMRIILARAVAGDWVEKGTEDRQAIYNRFRLGVNDVLDQVALSVEVMELFRSKVFLSLHKKLQDIRESMKAESVVSLEIPEVPVPSDFEDIGHLSDIVEDLEELVDISRI